MLWMYNDIRYWILVVIELIMAIVEVVWKLRVVEVNIMARMVGHNLEHIIKDKLVHKIEHMLVGQLLKRLMVEHRSLVVTHIELVAKHIELVAKRIRLVGLVAAKRIRLAAKQLKLIIKLVITQLRLVIKQPVEPLTLIRLVELVNGQLIFQLDNIQLFLDIYQLEHIQYISPRKLKEHILFNIPQHNSLSPFFLLEHITLLLVLHIQELTFNMGHTQFLTLPWLFVLKLVILEQVKQIVKHIKLIKLIVVEHIRLVIKQPIGYITLVGHMIVWWVMIELDKHIKGFELDNLALDNPKLVKRIGVGVNHIMVPGFKPMVELKEHCYMDDLTLCFI
jgi:hypothetical protein